MKTHSVRLVCLAFLCGTIFSVAVLAQDAPADKPITIKVGTYENSPKIFTDKEGNVSGFWADIIEYVVREEGWNAQYVHGTWTECLKRLEKNEIDMMPDVEFSEERSILYDFSNEVVLLSWSRVYAKEGTDMPSVLDLEGENIAVLEGSINVEGRNGIKDLVHNFDLDCNFTEVDSYTKVFELLESGEADAGVVNKDFGNKHQRDFDIEKTPMIFQPISLQFAFPKNFSLTPYLIQRIDYHLKELKENEDSLYYQSMDKYLGRIGGGLMEIIPAWVKNALWVVCAALLLFVVVGVVSRFQVKRKTRELQESEHKYRLLAENVSDIIKTMDMNLAITYVSPSVEDLTGYTPTELMGQSSLQIITPESQGIVKKTLEKELAKERQPDGNPSEPQTLQLEVCRKDGSKVWMESKVSLLRDEHGKPTGIISVSRDITERKKTEEEKEKLQAQLLQSQKMEAIGTLAGGVAHDFNNILMGVQGYTDFAMTSIGQGHPAYNDLRQAKKASVRASDLTRQLLLFSRRQPMDLTPLNLNQNIEDLKKMLIRIIEEDIAVETHLEEGIWTVQADAGNIEQVIMNLAVNARDAMPGGGKLTIRTENLLLDEDYCRQYTYAHPGRFVCLSVQDTGMGMDDETIAHIFEPFFTTKGPSGGTGLGLSVVYGIVKGHGGWINVSSEPEHGSVFKVYLPTTTKQVRKEAGENVSLEDLQGTGEKVLLVEDAPSVRDLLQRSMSENGYKVLVASTLQEAREVFRKEKGTLDIVLSDVVLPDGTGVELAEELRVQAPELPILLSSGYTDRKSQWSVIKEKGFLFLQKPYSLTDLLRTIKETIKGQTMIK